MFFPRREHEQKEEEEDDDESRPATPSPEEEARGGSDHRDLVEADLSLRNRNGVRGLRRKAREARELLKIALPRDVAPPASAKNTNDDGAARRGAARCSLSLSLARSFEGF